MRRVCFVLQVRPERLEEYMQRHEHVWPEMLEALHQSGWTNYSLFLRQDGLLVGYVEVTDFMTSRDAMAKLEINRRWQGEMAQFFTNPPGVTPDVAMSPLVEVFHLD